MPTASRALLANLTPRGRIVLGICALALVALVFLGMQIAGRPSYSLIDSGLDPAETGKVTAALDEKGIRYELRNNGTALAVEKSQTAQARIALAGAGLDGLRPDLAGELHAQARLLDGHDDLGRVGGGAGGERLRALGGVGLKLLEGADLVGEHAAEAAATAAAGGRADGDAAIAEAADGPLAATDEHGRVDRHQRRMSSVLVNICLAVCMTVTLAS
jgi:hypothetical protein